jgi:ribonuclease HI
MHGSECSIVEGEAVAILVAMKELEQQGFTNVIFKIDSKNVTDVVHLCIHWRV